LFRKKKILVIPVRVKIINSSLFPSQIYFKSKIKLKMKKRRKITPSTSALPENRSLEYRQREVENKK